MTRRGLPLLLPAAALCSLALGCAGASGGRPVPRTLASFTVPVLGFAQDGSRVAWSLTGGSCGVRVYERPLAGGAQTLLTPPGGATCSTLQQIGGGTSVLALAGTRALWAVFTASNTEYDVSVVSGRPGERDVAVGEDFLAGGLEATASTPAPRLPAAAAGAVLAFAAAGDAPGQVFLLRGRRAEPVTGVSGARALATDGSGLAVAVHSERGVPLADAPAWSPNGRTVAFASERNGYRELDLVPAAGGSWTRLAGSPLGQASDPAWSPDGTRLAYGSPSGLRLVGADGRGGRALTQAEAWQPSWAPDGKRIAFSAADNRSIAVVGADGTGLRTLFRVAGYSLYLTSPAWSPDGTRIAFTRSNPDLDKEQVLVGPATGGTGTAVASGDDPAWSPDGTRLAFDDCSIEIARSDGTGQRRLTTPPSGECDFDPSWSPDGSHVVFARGHLDTRTDLWVVATDGSGLRRLTTTAASPATDAVEVLTAAGRRVARVAGGARAVALSTDVLAVLVTGRLDLYDPATGKLLRSRIVPPDTTQVAVSGRRVVFASGRSIELLDAATGGLETLATAAARPVGLSITGIRVGWAENPRGKGRIELLALR